MSGWIAKHKIEILLAGLFFILLGLRVFNMEVRSPEYDEIWTIQNYVNVPLEKIFTEVATPNNHPLNSFLIRLSTSAFGISMLAIRLPALIAFCALFVLCVLAARTFLNSSCARAAFAALVILNGGILHYAETARGYALQTLFVFGAFLSLLLYEKFKDQSKSQILYGLLFLLSAVGACLSIASGVIFVTALSAAWWFVYTPFRKGFPAMFARQKILWGAFVLFAAFVMLWYGRNYSEFAKGQGAFGENIAGVFPFFQFAGKTLYAMGAAFFLLVAAGGLFWVRDKEKKRLLWMILATSGLVLLSAVVLKAGPARVYLPLLPLLAFAFGIVFDDLLARSEKLRPYGKLLLVALCAGGVFLSNKQYQEWSDPDLGTAFLELKERIKQEIYVVYRPTDAYVLLNIFGDEIVKDNLARMNAPRLLMLFHDNGIGCMGIADNNTHALPVSIPASESGTLKSGLPYWIYILRKVRTAEKLEGKNVICIVTGTNLPAILDPNSWLMKNFKVVNFFFTKELFIKKMPIINVFAAHSPSLTVEEMERLELENPSKIRFYVVGE